MWNVQQCVNVVNESQKQAIRDTNTLYASLCMVDVINVLHTSYDDDALVNSEKCMEKKRD